MLGETAALLTALCWSFNSVLFAMAGRKVGSETVNHIRIWIAFGILCVIHLMAFGSVFPFQIELKRFFYLALSGVIGFVIGDAFLFESFILIGPRLSMLIMLLSPVFSAMLAWWILGATLGWVEISGIAVTIAGIGWVVSDRVKLNQKNQSEIPTNQHTKDPEHKRRLILGILLSIGGAAGQSGGLLLSRLGLEGGFSPLSANLVRVTSATIILLLTAVFKNKIKLHFTRLKNKAALFQITGGALLGPVIGVILSLMAIAQTQVGVAATLMSISPVILIPLSRVLFKEKITFPAIMGTIIALSGVALLFFN